MDKQLSKLQKERQVVVANEYIFKLDFSSKQNNLNSPSGQNIEVTAANRRLINDGGDRR
jgi:hypothetical protein